MKKNVFKILFSILFVLFFSHGEIMGSEIVSLVGKIHRIVDSGKRIIINIDGNRKETIKISPSTRFYKKQRPLPSDMNAKLQDFSRGDRIHVFHWNTESSSPAAISVWGARAYAVKFMGIQTEKLFSGEVRSFKPRTGIVRLFTFDRKHIDLKITNSTAIIIDNEVGQLYDIRPGIKAAAYCRWLGFDEDRPRTPEAREFIDSSTFVIRKYAEKYGPLVANGKVVGVNIREKIIKVANPRGGLYTVSFSRITRWIPATPKIKSPVDFINYNVFIFGNPVRKGPSNGRMVMNVMVVNSFFQAAIRERELRGAKAILAYGEVLQINKKYIVVRSRNQKVKIRLGPKTIFHKKGKKIRWTDIFRGDRVLVKGIFGEPPIALIVRSFGKVKK